VIGRGIIPDEVIWNVPGPLSVFFYAVQLIAILGLMISLWQTDPLSFAGLSQVQRFLTGNPEVVLPPKMVTQGAYALVRHPLYFFSLLIIWLMPTMTLQLLIFNLATTVYFVVGSVHEERRLLAIFGEEYDEYSSRVPGIVPIKIKYLLKESKMDIEQDLFRLVTSAAINLAIVAAIVIAGRFVSKILAGASEKFLQRSGIDETLVSFFTKITYYTSLLFVALIALGVLGLPMTSVIAVLGASVLALGIALQDSLANLASGVLIIGLRPFVVGDYVEIDDVSGFVTVIGLFNTMLTTRDNKSVFIPNKGVLDGNLINYSKTELIRLDLVYGISYTDNIRKAKNILEEIVRNDARVATQPPPSVAVKELGDNSVNFVMRPYVHVRDELKVTYAITEEVKLSFDQEGITIPFPQRDVHLFQSNGKSA
ncbi:MAG: mechanosensitive ion channel domain-containing protein, partial [Candidatus Promineifilaceae bacterium]